MAEGFAKFEKCSSLQPDFPGLQGHWGQFLLEARQYQLALPHLEQAVAQDPHNLDNLMNLSMAFIKSDRHADAIQLLLQVEQKDKWNPQAHYLLGTHFMGAGDLPKAREHLQKALEEKPDFTDAAVNLALVLCEQGETLDAVRQMRPVIRRLPESAQMNFFYGLILFRHGDTKDALAKYHKALSLEPELTAAKIAIGEAYLKLEQLPEAEKTLETILQHEPGNGAARFLLSLCLSRLAETQIQEAQKRTLWKAADHHLKLLLSRDPHHQEARINKAIIHGHLQSVEAMNSDFETILADFPQDQATTLYYWAKSLERMGQVEAANAKMQQAKTHDPAIEAFMESIAI